MTKINAVFVSVCGWIGSTGATRIDLQPGIWRGRTEAANGIGPFDVRFNPHENEIDGVYPLQIIIGDEASFPGIVGVFDPSGGFVMNSARPGEDEDGLIAHFDHQPSVISAREVTP